MKKRVAAIILIVFISQIFSFISTASLISPDGKLTEKIWVEQPFSVAISSGDISNCGVKTGMVSIIVDNENNIVYLGFKGSCAATTGEKSAPGVSVSIDGSEFMVLTTDGVSTFDADKYSFSGKVFAMSDSRYTAEAVIGMKYGIKAGAKILYRFYDMDGAPSNVYYASVPATPTESEQPTSAVVGGNSQGKTNQTEKYTTSITRKQTTTKMSTERLTTERTTKAKKTTEKVAATKNKATRKSSSVDKKDITQKIVVQADVVTVYITVPIVSENQSDTQNSAQSNVELRINRTLMYACVIGLIAMALAVCVFSNVAHERRHKEAENLLQKSAQETKAAPLHEKIDDSKSVESEETLNDDR